MARTTLASFNFRPLKQTTAGIPYSHSVFSGEEDARMANAKTDDKRMQQQLNGKYAASPPLLLTTDSVLPKSPSSSLNGNHQQGSKGTEDSEAQHLIGSGQTQGGLGGCEVETQ